ncbi:Translation initiation factor IF-2 [Candidatus Westeberhardia cardiocondylae]|uniref:Translation initiation factor IF-2 n=1 Tax=Candidatus Westeberhardia cardiocondylae TaxID=1594731 RepID=A0A0H5BWQ6_9ENTR|nr:translation initiation factor IF-2 [Candidatus Westeberhardia cardiocondylae]CEN32152.1 Translation initiation factor IF-2 [Candidatus Westeberhardia cardiocondylae]
MTNITVKLLSLEIQISVGHLLQQFSDIGINKTELDYVTKEEKEILLLHLKKNQEKYLNKLTVQRKKQSTLNIFNIEGKNKSIHIEIRKKRTYLKEDLNENTVKNDFFKKNKIVNNLSYLKNENIDLQQRIKKTCIFVKNKKSFEKNKISKNEILSLKNNSKKSFKNMKKGFVKGKFKHNSISISKKKNVFLNDSAYTKHHTLYNEKKEDKFNYKIKNKKCFYDRAFTEKKINRFIPKRNKKKSFLPCNNITKKYETLNLSISKHNNINIKRTKNKCCIVIGENITLLKLANKMSIKVQKIFNILKNLNIFIEKVDQIISQNIAKLIAENVGYRVVLYREDAIETSIMSNRNVGVNFVPLVRAPVVTVMGHVDHGKTSLLDYIRSEKTALKEIGGITQSIGAYHVKTKNGMITFIDTPGHAAFSSMRTRGVKITDIVLLIIAADDGIMPQTVEAIQHAKTEKVPIIVVINKIDRLTENLDNIKKELSGYGILSEDWGGENQFVYTSAKTGQGIDDLLSAILAQAEIMELKAIHEGMASGIVIESYLNKGWGPVATILVKEGKLKCGDIVLCGFEYGKIRAIRNDIGHNVISAGPSMPVEILGLSNTPNVGDKIVVVYDEKKAKEVATYRKEKFREIKLEKQKKIFTLENVFSISNKNKIFILKIVLKSNTNGSLEAIVNSLKSLSNEKIIVKIVGMGVGNITESDVVLAASSKTILIGFNVRCEEFVHKILIEENVDFCCYSVIYDLINDVKKKIFNFISLKDKRKIIGLVEVRNIFRPISCNMMVIGCVVIKGVVKRYSKIRVLRNREMIYEGKMESLRRFKHDVNEVQSGMECGISIKNFHEVRLKDIIEVLE